MRDANQCKFAAWERIRYVLAGIGAAHARAVQFHCSVRGDASRLGGNAVKRVVAVLWLMGSEQRSSSQLLNSPFSDSEGFEEPLCFDLPKPVEPLLEMGEAEERTLKEFAEA